ncbi:family 43 glycosylhydrolase [Cellulomonas triticagri]|uniref:Chitin-binding type-3 domain-containing protein n=1 Tax=Cellulomonas triticagri TaxID=2483352 RepID=A0A3M2JH45_9CELL|nr:family 43 glycosylhydrolase [Cellulomonas triticagri]RMI09598.1 hypothetical protein EBM89_09730 [Cellulomonas triticagri]
MSITAPRPRSRRSALLVLLLSAALLIPWLPATAHAATTTRAVQHTDVSTTRGTPWQTYYEGDEWASNARVHWGNDGDFLEIPFEGDGFRLYGSTRTTNGTAEVYVDDALVGTVDYHGANSNAVIELFSHTGLEPGAHTLRVVAVGWVNHARAEFDSTATEPVTDGLPGAVDAAASLAEADYTAGSWAALAARLTDARTVLADAAATAEQRAEAATALDDARAALVMVRGLREAVESYATRVPGDHTPVSWAPFAAALARAGDVLADADATAPDVVAAKTGLQDAAAGLVTLGAGTLGTIQNNDFWHDTDGNPIYSQGGGIFRFGDTYYWYGVRYDGAELYYANPTRLYNNNVNFESVTAYSSKDLVSWTFENDIATTETPVDIPASKDVNGDYFSRMQTLGDAVWIGRLGVVYNESTGKYVLLTQFENADPARVTNAGVLFLQGDSPTGDFEYANLQTHVPGVYENPNKPGWNQGSGDQTVFTDDDGSDYLVFSYRDGRSRTYVARISDTDSLSVETAVEVFRGAGREGNAMFKMGGRYYVASSALHGWNTSQTYIVESETDDIQGDYSDMYVLEGTEKDYSHVTQSGFFVTVPGTQTETVIYAGDRWADFAWNGLGYNQWLPITATDDRPLFHSVSQWRLNAVTGEWEVGEGNNYVLNPDFAADRIPVTAVTGWTTAADPGSAPFVSNPTPGADGSRFALRLGADAAFSGAVRQENAVPDGTYRFATRVSTAGGLDHARVRITGAAGQDHVLDLNAATDGWATAELADLRLTGGTATVSIEAAGPAGTSVTVDGLSLVRQPEPAWSADATYVADDSVQHDGSLWVASWWTRAQEPGDPNGPWQEIARDAAGDPLWTPTRIFDAGDEVVHEGTRYRAAWWTRAQAPTLGGPWSVVS